MAKSLQQKMDQEWRAQADLRALREAEAIRADRSRVSAAKAEGRKELNALKKITAGRTGGTAKRGK